MDDNFLYDLRREPAPEFARRLRASLRGRESEAQGVDRRLREAQGSNFRLRAAKWATAAASIAVVSLAFTFPAVRAGAQAFLDLFRIANVVGVSFDPERLSELQLRGLDLPRMLGHRVEVLTEPTPPVSFETPEDASPAAGVPVLEPAWIPAGWERDGIDVSGEHAARVTANTTDLQRLLEQLEIDDLSIPAGLDGQTATVRVPPVVRITYRNDEARAHLLQARSPEVSFPADLDLSVLAEIGLRIVGVDREEAHRLATTIDWRSTLLVPVPATSASFRQVDVAGRNGLMIVPERRRGPATLLWATDDRVFAISGPLQQEELLEMAQTVQ